MRHFVADHQLTQSQLLSFIDLAKTVKAEPEKFSSVLAGKTIAMLFEKPSLRTMVSFEVGIKKLGGHAINLGQQNGKLGERERTKDYAKNLSCFVDGIVARVFEHEAILELADEGSVPVVNALCDWYHPCQGLADFVTLSEYYPDLSKVRLAYVGDSNNVSNSLMTLAATLGMDFTLICPEGHEPAPHIVEQTEFLYQEVNAGNGKGKLTISHDLTYLNRQEGQQDVIYTDTWISMGGELDTQSNAYKTLMAKFAPYQVNHKLMQRSGATKVMHCQPAHLEQEITTELFDDANKSIVFQQAENRLWAQCAVLVSIFSPKLALFNQTHSDQNYTKQTATEPSSSEPTLSMLTKSSSTPLSV
ncbi:ornithine carbamoyltransferase [Psychrosphaera ytuae]|uniref:Ornithine carbamoyltransferase n=1 Tax=Psychrosphaera ytuae TaxID=2820710 RepID=A0A975HJJ3_9GAMM|nr:ornithine carbamoyltransferase [Psychrosphaera ytuae]QTH65370.1 ornithine carbamoyltransferase [Psychrosphaera ytuae]